MASADLTRYALSLGSRDSTTGWYAKSFSSSTIEGSIQPRGAVVIGLPVGGVAKYPHTLFTADVVYIGDEVKDSNGDYYEVKSVDWYWWLDQVSHAQCSLEKRSPYALRPTTSGTWHLDSDSAKTDPRYRHKLWLDTYLEPTHISGDYITCFAGADYPMSQVFLTNDVDGVIAVDRIASDNLLDYAHYPYAFVESVPFHCYTVDKAGLTATNLLEQIEQEIRCVYTDHPVTGSSMRDIDSTEYKCHHIGAATVWETIITVKYKRWNDDYVPTYPRVTWGPTGAPTGTYYFPNCVDLQEVAVTKDAWIDAFTFQGSPSQAGGCKAFDWILECDLDVGNTTYAWKRAQTGAATDVDKWDVFRDIIHNAGIDEDYQTLTLSASGPSLSVRLVDYHTGITSLGERLYVTFREYRTTSATGTHTARLGLS